MVTRHNGLFRRELIPAVENYLADGGTDHRRD
jgi:hypothetical protein